MLKAHMDAIRDETAHKKPDRWFAVTLGWTCLLCGLAGARIFTLASGQDPQTYLVLARRLLEARWAGAAWRELVAFIAPGYPAFLSVIMAVGGAVAPYVVSIAVCALCFSLLAAVWRECADERCRGDAPWLAALSLLLVWHGDPLNAHFLLLPFREGLALTLGLGGVWLLWRAAACGRARTALAASLLAGLAASVREPMALLFAAPWLWLALAAARGRVRARIPLVFAAPWLAGLLLLLAAWAAGLWQPSFQMKLWWRYAVGADALTVWLARLRQTAGWALQAWGLWGWLAAAWGLWCVRRRAAIWTTFPAAAVALWLFHAGYRPHRRYLLVSMVLLAPLVAAGLLDLAHRLMGLLRRRAGPRVTVALAAVLVLLVGLAAGQQLAALHPWGQRVTVAQVHALRQAMSEGPVYADPRCRHLVDALVVHTRARPLDPRQIAPEALVRTTAWFLEPLDPACHHDGPARAADAGIPPRRVLEAAAALAPPTAVLRVGAGRFALRAVRPHPPGGRARVVECRPAEESVAWVNLGLDAGAAGTLRVVAASGGAWDWPVAGAPGWRPLIVTGMPPETAVIDLTAGADRVALPPRPHAIVAPAGEPVVFHFDERRDPAVESWYTTPGLAAGPCWAQRFAAPLGAETCLTVPAPPGGWGEWRPQVALAFARRARAAAATLRVTMDARTRAYAWPAGRPELRVEGACPDGVVGLAYDGAPDEAALLEVRVTINRAVRP